MPVKSSATLYKTIADKVDVVMVTQRQFINRLLTGDTVCWTSPVLQKSSTPTKDILAPRKRRYINIYSRFLMAILRKNIDNLWPVAPCASNSNSALVLRLWIQLGQQRVSHDEAQTVFGILQTALG